MQTAKVFRHGGSQAVRLPAEYRFDRDEVFVWRDEATGYLVLSAQPASWTGFIGLRDQLLASPGQYEIGPWADHGGLKLTLTAIV